MLLCCCAGRHLVALEAAEAAVARVQPHIVLVRLYDDADQQTLAAAYRHVAGVGGPTMP